MGQVYDVPQVSEVQVGDILKRVGSIDVPADGEFSDFFLAIRENPDGPIIDYVVERNGLDVVVQGPAMDLARISSLIPRSTAIEAGLKVGDVITHVNGDPINYFSDLRAAVEGSNGAPLSLMVYRGGKRSISICNLKRWKSKTTKADMMCFGVSELSARFTHLNPKAKQLV